MFTHDGQVIDEISPRSRDTIIGLGEKLACKMMTAILRDRVCVASYLIIFLTYDNIGLFLGR